MNTVLHYLNLLATSLPWAAIGQGILASGILSAFLTVPYRYIKKWFYDHREVIMILFVGFAGMAVSFVHYLMSVPTFQPTIVALQGMAIAFGTQPLYLIVIKPLFAFIYKKIQAEVLKATALNADIKSAAAPVETVAPAAPVVDNFGH